MTTTISPKSKPATTRRDTAHHKGTRRTRANIFAGAFGWIWLAIIILPLYYIIITSFKDQSGFFTENPLLPTAKPTLANYAMVFENDFLTYFTNSMLVLIGSVVPTVALSFMAAYGIMRSTGWFAGMSGSLFLLGLAIPLQATAIPMYYMITKVSLYDSLVALMLPSIAFSIPVAVLVLGNFLRDVPKELFESMRLDGCSEWTMMWRLALPLTKPAVVTITIYTALNNWNGFLFPLILTQSPEKRVLPLSLWTFQDEFTVNTPALLAAVVLSAIPLVIAYAFGRRQLVSGLTAGFSK